MDTLEQCLSVIVEKVQSAEQQEKSSGRLSSLDYQRVNDVNGEVIISSIITKQETQIEVDQNVHKCVCVNSTGVSPPSTVPSVTKILYFTNRSSTPFMSSVQKRLGEVTLRDFKTLFDRPGFFRFHFKAMDQEFGMVKEEVRFPLTTANNLTSYE